MMILLKYWKFTSVIFIIAVGYFLIPKLWEKHGFEIYSKKTLLIQKARIYNDSVSVAKLSKENILMDSLLYSMQQDIDILKSNEVENQAVTAQLTKERNNSRQEAKRAVEAIEKYEVNGLMRYFVFDKRGIFKKGCYEEVFEKPENICN